MKEQTFNKWFNIFILAGMTVAVIIATIFKFDSAESGQWMLVVSAIGSLMGVLSTVCSANGKIWTFVFGFFDVAIYGAMCFIGAKYGNAILHFVYFVPMQFVGFFQWKKRGASKGEGGSGLKARRMGLKQWIAVTAVFLAGSIVSYMILQRFDHTEADSFLKMAVVLDVLPLMCNIIGQLLMSMAYMEQWIFWIGVNIFSILMWSSSLEGATDSYALIYIIKYSFYLLNSFNGLRIWAALSKRVS